MTKRTKTMMSLAAICVSLAVAQGVRAEEGDSPHSFSGNATFTNDYVFRGVTQSMEDPAVQAGLDYGHESGVYVGVWGSSINFGGTEESAEIDFYAGYGGEIGAISYDVSGIYYAYPGVPGSDNFDFVDVVLALGYEADMFSVGASVNYSPDYFGSSDDAFYLSGDVSVPVGDIFAVDLHIAHQSIKDNAAFGLPDYTDWSAGVSASIIGFDLSLAYLDTDIKDDEGAEGLADGRVVFAIGRTF